MDNHVSKVPLTCAIPMSHRTQRVNSNNVESYSFKSVKCPPAIQEMADFENDLQRRVQANKKQFSRKT